MSIKSELLKQNAKRIEHLHVLDRTIKELVFVNVTEYQYEDLRRIILFLNLYSDMSLTSDIIITNSKVQKCDRSVIKLISMLRDLKRNFNKHRELLKKFGYLNVISETETIIATYQEKHGKLVDRSEPI